MASLRLGRFGERLAQLYLLAHGYRIVARSWRAGRFGEIDLIVRRRDILAFVEVKTRRSRRHGPPEEAVHPGKQKRILRLAEAFLASLSRKSSLRSLTCRLDVIAVELSPSGRWRIRHLPGAFDVNTRRTWSRGAS